jgi:hypothetical protein
MGEMNLGGLGGALSRRAKVSGNFCDALGARLLGYLGGRLVSGERQHCRKDWIYSRIPQLNGEPIARETRLMRHVDIALCCHTPWTMDIKMVVFLWLPILRPFQNLFSLIKHAVHFWVEWK